MSASLMMTRMPSSCTSVLLWSSCSSCTGHASTETGQLHRHAHDHDFDAQVGARLLMLVAWCAVRKSRIALVSVAGPGSVVWEVLLLRSHRGTLLAANQQLPQCMVC